MFCPCLAVDHYVIQIYCHLLLMGLVTLVRQPLECGQGPCNPKGIVRNWYKPKGVAKANFSLDSGVNRICQYPFIRSRVIKYQATPSWSSNSSTHGTRYASNFKIPLTFWKSMQNRVVPSHFGTSTVGLLQSLFNSVTPRSSMGCSSCFFILLFL